MMNLAKLICALLFLLVGADSFAQEEDHWETYLAAYEKGPGITWVNMSLKNKAPIKDQGFILITGVSFSPCKDGLPAPEIQESLEAIDDAVARQVSFLGKTTLAGNWTHNCERLNYFYIQDSMDVRFSLQTFYKDNFPNYKYTINIRNDPEWEGYLKFLYPNEIVKEQIEVTKVLEQLSAKGDQLKKERPVDYTLSFPDEKSRKVFVDQMKKEGFSIAQEGKDDDLRDTPWYVRIAKTAMPNAHTISGMILYLRKKAAESGGKYKEWSIPLIKN